MNERYGPVVPKRKWFKESVSSVVLWVLGRAFQSAARMDAGIRREVAEWEEGFSLWMRILPEGPSLRLEKEDGRLRAVSTRRKETATLILQFKNIESAFLVLTPQMGAAKAFAENRMSVAGDLGRALSFMRCLNRIIAYLYPQFLSNRLLKKQPDLVRPVWRRIYLYTIGIPFGL